MVIKLKVSCLMAFLYLSGGDVYGISWVFHYLHLVFLSIREGGDIELFFSLYPTCSTNVFLFVG